MARRMLIRRWLPESGGRSAAALDGGVMLESVAGPLSELEDAGEPAALALPSAETP